MADIIEALAPATYSGLLDDVVQRYPTSTTIGEDFFGRAIAKNIFFSGDIFLNDGYLVNHPAAQRMLINEESILRVMIRNNFVRVLSRQNDPVTFVENPLIMAKQIGSFRDTVNSAIWPDLQKALRRVAPVWFERSLVRPWPKRQMHLGFVDLITRTFLTPDGLPKRHADLGLAAYSELNIRRLMDRFLQLNPASGAPRDKFETAVVEEVDHISISNPRAAKIELMNIANQCYHYNFAMCLSDEIGQSVVADSSIGLAFEDILDLDDTFEAELANLSLIDIPRNLPLDNAGPYVDILDGTTDVGHAKRQFLIAMNDLFNLKRAAADRRKDVEAAAAEYREQLSKHFAKSMKMPRWTQRFGSAISLGIGGIGPLDSVVSAAGNAALAVGILAPGAPSFLQAKYDAFVLRPLRQQYFRNLLEPVGVERGNVLRMTVGEVKPRFASLAFNKNKVKEHVSRVPAL